MGIKIVKRQVADDGLIPTGKQLKPGIRKAVDRLNKMFESLGSYFIDRSTELEQIKLALLTKEHALQKGEPGTAKSLMSKTVFESISGSSLFAIQFTKFMSEDYIFGPPNIKKLREEGVIVHNTKGSLVDCDFAFIDEAFDGSDVLLRSTLEVLNERTFTRSGTVIHAPLHTAILTSNYVRDEEVTEAFLDRILFKTEVQPIQDGDGRMQMYRNALSRTGKNISKVKFSDLKDVVAFIDSDEVTISDTVLAVFDEVVREFKRQTTKVVSDRTCVKMLKVLKASAVLHGRKSALLEDVLSIQTALCMASNVQEQQVFENVYHRIVVQGRKDRAELADVLKLKHKVERVVNSKMSDDEDKDTVMKIKALQKFVNDELTEAQRDVTSDTAKEELDKIGSTVDDAIQGLKQLLDV